AFYNSPLATLTVQAPKSLPVGFIEAFYERFATLAVEWQAFIPLWSGVKRNRQWLGARLGKGFSHTLYLPTEVANELQALCWLYEVEASCMLQSWQYCPKPLKIPPPFKALFIGPNYVIARDFSVSTLR
uniref:hypothetical protein n=1 Tax=Hymenobacter sp. AT01-02 TaxID=1571877 RepID=UPI0005F236F5